MILLGGACFCISSVAFLYVKTTLRPKNGQWEEGHWEFEDRDPALRRYYLWSRLLFAAIMVSMLLLFIAISV